MDDRITSWSCGINVQYEFWRHGVNEQISGKIAVATGAGRIDNTVLAYFNDLITNIVLEPYD